MELIRMEQISKSFGKVKALDNASFSLKQGEIHAILGENGAGKTTLLKVLYGMIGADTGHIFLNEKEVKINSTKQALEMDIGMVHQHFMLIPVLTVAENIVAGQEPKIGVRFDFNQAVADVKALCQRSGFDVDPLAQVESLSVGELQKVEILKILYRDVDILILDEPTAVLTPIEVKELFASLKLLQEEGKSIVLITHKLQEIMEIADRVTIMRDGKTVETIGTVDASPEKLAEMMVGRKVVLNERRRSTAIGEPILALDNLTYQHNGQTILNELSLKVNAGEILGIAGIEGNGQTELIEILTGITQPDNLNLTLEGKPMTGGAKEFIANGIGHVPEDRMTRGLVLSMNITENIILGYENLAGFAKNKLIDWQKSRKIATELINRFEIKPENPDQKTSALSGGNQQKVVIARVFGQESKVVICAQPTRGVDVSAIETIHKIMLDYRDQGHGILLISADLEEVKKLSDRIAVIYNGELVADDYTENFDDTRLGLLMTSGVEGRRHAK